MNELINRQEMLRYFQVAPAIDEKVLLRFINEAQLLDVKPLLGDVLYHDLLLHKNTEKYQSLLYGINYVAGENPVVYEGLQRPLAYFAYARYIVRNAMADTPFGLVTKNHHDASPKSDTDKRQLAKEIRQDAYLFFKETEQYLNAHRAEFSLWKQMCCKASAKVGKLRFDIL